jgi:hypothetical protein
MVSQVSYKAINLVSSNGSISITDLANGDTNLQTTGGGGSGTVTSVGLTAPSIFSVGGSPVTTSGTLALTYSGTALPIANGGTASTTATSAFNRLTGYTTNTTASISLATTSTYNQFFIGGSSSATLPDVTTLTLGYTFHIVNQTSATLNVAANDGTTIFLIPINTGMLFTCISIASGTDATAWIYATSDLWSTGDGASSGNTGITGIGKVVLQMAPTISNATISNPTISNATISNPTISNATSISLQSVAAEGGLTLTRNSTGGTTSTRMYLDSSTSVNAIYNNSGSLLFNTNATIGSSAGVNQFRVAPVGSAVDYVQVTGSATGNPANVTLTAAGTDANINLVLTAKGTGTIKFGTYTAGTVAQAGYITITDSGGTSRRLLVG